MSGPPSAAYADAASTVYDRGAAAAVTAAGQTDALDCHPEALNVSVNVTAVGGVGPSITFILEHQVAGDAWAVVHTFAAITAVGSAQAHVGRGLPTNVVLTGKVRLRWTVAGTTPSVTFTARIVGR